MSKLEKTVVKKYLDHRVLQALETSCKLSCKFCTAEVRGSSPLDSTLQNLRLTFFTMCTSEPLQIRRRYHALRLERFLALTERLVLHNRRVRGMGPAEFADPEGSVERSTQVKVDELSVARSPELTSLLSGGSAVGLVRRTLIRVGAAADHNCHRSEEVRTELGKCDRE